MVKEKGLPQEVANKIGVYVRQKGMFSHKFNSF